MADTHYKYSTSFFPMQCKPKNLQMKMYGGIAEALYNNT